MFKNSIDSKTVKNIEERGLDRDRIVGKELAALMLAYDEKNYDASVRNAKLYKVEQAKSSKVEQDIEELNKKMQENVNIRVSMKRYY